MSKLTLRNATEIRAEFVVAIGDHGLGRAAVPPGGEAAVPTNLYQVTAATLHDGNAHQTAPVDAARGTGFLAEMLQTVQQGTYEFSWWPSDDNDSGTHLRPPTAFRVDESSSHSTGPLSGIRRTIVCAS